MIRLVGAVALLLLSACTSGLFTQEAVKPLAGARQLEVTQTLTKGARAQATYYVENGSYTFDANDLDLEVPDGVAISITQTTSGSYCMTGTHEELEGEVWHVTTDQTVPQDGPCPP